MADSPEQGGSTVIRRALGWNALARRRAQLLDERNLRPTIDRLVAEGRVSSDRGAALHRDLPRTIKASSYVLKHLGAHLAIGAIRVGVPLPIGSIGRVLWVSGSRAYETLYGTRERARVHSLPVLGIAAIPFLGYGAYLLPLRRQSEDAAYLYANHLSYARYDCCMEKVLESKPRLVRKLGRRLFLPSATGAS